MQKSQHFFSIKFEFQIPLNKIQNKKKYKLDNKCKHQPNRLLQKFKRLFKKVGKKAPSPNRKKPRTFVQQISLRPKVLFYFLILPDNFLKLWLMSSGQVLVLVEWIKWFKTLKTRFSLQITEPRSQSKWRLSIQQEKWSIILKVFKFICFQSFSRSPQPKILRSVMERHPWWWLLDLSWKVVSFYSRKEFIQPPFLRDSNRLSESQWKSWLWRLSLNSQHFSPLAVDAVMKVSIQK